MSVLGRHARAVITSRGVKVADFLTHVYGPNHGGEWHGDRCGCPDDRCAGGFHHDGGDEDCGCLPAILDEMLGQGVWVDIQRARGVPDGAAAERGFVALDREYTDEELRNSPYADVLKDAVVVSPDEYRSGPV